MIRRLIRLTFTALGCLSSLISVSASEAFGQDYTVKIGAIYPLSGELAYVGQDIREGIELALEERGERKPRIEVIWEDNKFSLKDSVSAAQKLISENKVDFIFSLWDAADVIAPITEKARVIQLSIRWNPDVAAKHSYTFTFESTYKSFARDMVSLIKRLGKKRVGFINEETQGNILEAEEFERLAPQAGIEVIKRESVTSGDKDFRPILTRLLAKNPELLITETWPPMTETIIRQLGVLRPGLPHTGYYEVIEDLSVIEGQPFVSQLGYTPEFSAKFERRFGHPYRIRAAHSYEMIRMLEWAYGAFDSKPTTAQIRDKLSTLKDFDSVLGRLSVNSTRNIEHPNVFKVVKEGKLVKFGDPD